MAKTRLRASSLLEGEEQAAERADVGGPAKGEPLLERRFRSGAEGEDKHVVGKLEPIRRPHDVPLRLDRGERAEGESRTVGARDPRKLEGASVAGGERLCDGERPVPELRLRSDE